MNWSIYSEFVGDVFGAPLAIEGLAAFMLESTFLGLWIFGWDRLSKRVHLATIWIFALGSWLSAFFIIVANSWMQRPVGSTITRRARRADGRLGAHVEPARDRRLHARDPGRAHDGVRGRLRHRLLAPRARPEPGALPAGGEARADRRRAGLRAEPRDRQPPRRGHHRLPADEDRRDRGAVGDGAAGVVLALPDRGLLGGRPDAGLRHRDPVSPLDPRDRLAERRGAGDEPAPGRVRGRVRRGELHPAGADDVLEHADHGLRRRRSSSSSLRSPLSSTGAARS